MLNRRILRVKAMQAVYAYKQAKMSNHDLILDTIAEFYSDKLDVIGHNQKKPMMEEKEKAIAYFEEHLIEGVSMPDRLSQEESTPEQVAIDGIHRYQSKCANDVRLYKSEMLGEAEGIFRCYISILDLGVKLVSTIVEENREKSQKSKKEVLIEPLQQKLLGNKTVDALKKSVELEKEVAENKIAWSNEVIRPWYKLLLKDEQFTEVLKNEDATDNEIARKLYLKFILGNDTVASHFEEENINWHENKHILNVMLKKTLKEIAENDFESVRLFELSMNWDDDKHFFEKLYDKTIEGEDDFEEIIAAKSKKWASNRIALLDKVLLCMAIAEAQNFPSIPTKVTINEYIDISKQYSTPKSWQFINGLLDVIFEEQVNKGLIKKSGRGLLDNK